MKSKLVLFVLFACFFYSTANAQCIADAGPDKIICTNLFGPEPGQIGVIPSASNGTPPYTYLWETKTKLVIGNFTYQYHASDFLDNVSLPNPSWTSQSADIPIEFTLTVTDAALNVCKDTINIEFSNWGILLSEPKYFINLGDSVLLSGSNAFSNFPLVSYLYSPNQGLTDSTSERIWVKPIVNTKYSLKVTDSSGCSFNQIELHEVYVNTVGIQNNSNQSLKIETFPNPAVNFLTINTDEKIKSFRITDMIGRNMIQSNFSSKELDVSSLKSGNYLIQFLMGSGSQGFGRFVKK